MSRQTSVENRVIKTDVEKIAEAVLYEGYLLFPYRRSALKNQHRWTFGGVYPRGFSEANAASDPWQMQTQCLIAGDTATEIEIKLRFLHVADRRVVEGDLSSRRFVEELRVGELVHRPWEEAIEREMPLCADPGEPSLRLDDLLAEGRRFPLDVAAGEAAEPLFHPEGAEAGAIVREWRSLQGTVEVAAERLPRSQGTSVGDVYRLTVRIANVMPWPNEESMTAARNDALRQTFVATHTILRVHGGEFLSLLEPPDEWRQAAGECENIKTWPVLVGEPGERHTLLSSPIILYDYPQISPESQGNYFDATEIDELLALTVLTLTDEEKREMRESDAHSREILERTEELSEEQLLKLHGVVRALQPVQRETTATETGAEA
jgi:hypothetical protein